MAYQVIVKKRFTRKIVKLLVYLEAEWDKNVARQFINNLEHRIETLAEQPFQGIQTELKNCRSILITKQNRLYYRINENKIEILNMYDTRINPAKNPYKKK